MYVPLFIVFLSIPIASLRSLVVYPILLMSGVYEMDDNNFIKIFNKNNQEKGKVILSNHQCILDVFYFLYR